MLVLVTAAVIGVLTQLGGTLQAKIFDIVEELEVPLLGRRRVGEGTPAYALRDRPALCSRILRDSEGQAVAKFSLVIFILILVLFSILEVGLLLNDKMVLMSTARSCRICAVEEGKTQNALDRLRDS